MQQPFGDQRQFGRIPAMRQLGADIVLVDQRIERGVRGAGAIGLDLDREAIEPREHFRERRGLQRGLAAGQDKAARGEGGDVLGDLRFGQCQLVGFARMGLAAAMRALIAGEVPGIGRVAPHAGEVAARQAHEGAGHAHARSFALHRGEDFRFVRGLGGEDQGHYIIRSGSGRTAIYPSLASAASSRATSAL